MKIKLDVDASPEELRAFLGLPDVRPMQDEIMKRIRQRMLDGVEDSDAVTLLKPFLSQGVQSFETLQRAFWEAFDQQGQKPGPTDPGRSSQDPGDRDPRE